MIKRMMLLSAAVMLINASGADSPESAPQQTAAESGTLAADVQAQVNRKTARIQTLTAQHSDLIEKQKKKRQELLKTNPRLRRMYLQILKQTRQLALELDSDREMNALNDQIHAVEKELKQEQTELNNLKKTEKGK